MKLQNTTGWSYSYIQHECDNRALPLQAYICKSKEQELSAITGQRTVSPILVFVDETASQKSNTGQKNGSRTETDGKTNTNGPIVGRTAVFDNPTKPDRDTVYHRCAGPG